MEVITSTLCNPALSAPLPSLIFTITTPSSGVDYYYTIQHAESGKYLVCDPYFARTSTLGEKNDSRRKTMHLETKDWTTTIPDKALFKIRYTSDESTGEDNFDSYCFIPKRVEGKSYKYLNLADRTSSSCFFKSSVINLSAFTSVCFLI